TRWPPVLKPNILTPAAILQQQAQALGEQTKGVLVGAVVKGSSPDTSKVLLHLDIIAPALDNYRRRILSAHHEANAAHPVFLDSPVLPDPSLSLPFLPDEIGGTPKLKNQADNDDEFRTLIAAV